MVKMTVQEQLDYRVLDRIVFYGNQLENASNLEDVRSICVVMWEIQKVTWSLISSDVADQLRKFIQILDHRISRPETFTPSNSESFKGTESW